MTDETLAEPQQERRPPDLEAEIRLLATAAGGRGSACYSGYRPNHDFGLKMLNDATHEYIGSDSVEPGASAGARLWLHAPEYQRGRLYEGFAFTVQEAERVIGHGVITRVLSPELRDPTRSGPR